MKKVVLDAEPSLLLHHDINPKLKAKQVIFIAFSPLDTSLRDGLLVFFLLVLPLLIIVAVAIVKRDAIKRRIFRGRRRRQRYEKNKIDF